MSDLRAQIKDLQRELIKQEPCTTCNGSGTQYPYGAQFIPCESCYGNGYRTEEGSE
jgi:DnaJ-class molecular chaperone